MVYTLWLTDIYGCRNIGTCNHGCLEIKCPYSINCHVTVAITSEEITDEQAPAYYTFIFTPYAVLQYSLNLPIMLNIMLKNKNCIRSIIPFIYYIQQMILKNTILLVCIYE